MTECSICSRESTSDSDLCEYHMAALAKLRDAFKEWERAMNIGWEDYLTLVSKTEGLGSWVREVANHIISADTLLGPS